MVLEMFQVFPIVMLWELLVAVVTTVLAILAQKPDAAFLHAL